MFKRKPQRTAPALLFAAALEALKTGADQAEAAHGSVLETLATRMVPRNISAAMLVQYRRIERVTARTIAALEKEINQ